MINTTGKHQPRSHYSGQISSCASPDHIPNSPHLCPPHLPNSCPPQYPSPRNHIPTPPHHPHNPQHQPKWEAAPIKSIWSSSSRLPPRKPASPSSSPSSPTSTSPTSISGTTSTPPPTGPHRTSQRKSTPKPRWVPLSRPIRDNPFLAHQSSLAASPALTEASPPFP